MDKVCCIIGCKSTSQFTDRQFYQFPLESNLCRKWAEACGDPQLLKDLTYGGVEKLSTKTICSWHFNENDFIDPKSKQLKPDAFPKFSPCHFIKTESDDYTRVTYAWIKNEGFDEHNSSANTSGDYTLVTNDVLDKDDSSTKLKANMEEEQREELKDFFEIVEDNQKIQIPSFVKNLLKICGFDNRLAFSNMSENDLEEIVRFARNDLPDLIERNKFEDYYGPLYRHNPQKFQLLIGHRKLLTAISENIKNTPLLVTTPQLIEQKHKRMRLPSQEIAPNLQEESKEVRILVIKWLKSLKMNDAETKTMDDFILHLECKCSPARDGLISCQIPCYICNNNIKVKQISKRGKKAYWCLSNYYQHCTKHTEKE